MRVVGLVACLAVLSMEVLRPPQSLAQATATSEAHSLRHTEGQTARTQAPRTSRPGSATTGAPTPVPPSFYSMSQLGDHLYSVRWELAIVGAAIATIGFKDWDWGHVDGFQTIEEGWFAKNTRHGGMDKRLEAPELRGFAKHAVGQRGAVHAFGAGRPGEMRFDLVDQRAVRALQPMHGGIGVKYRHALLGKHLRDGRLAHADRPGEPEDQRHDVSLSRSSASCARGAR